MKTITDFKLNIQKMVNYAASRMAANYENVTSPHGTNYLHDTLVSELWVDTSNIRL